MAPAKRVAVGFVAALALAGAFWAGRTTMGPMITASDQSASEVLAEVSQQTVGRQLNLNVTVVQPKQALAVNALTGVVTAIGRTTSVKCGDTLYAVGSVPVRAVQGGVPFYRSLQVGASGPDVRQLQDTLVGLGFLRAVDGHFGSSTAQAVMAWQAKLGQNRTGQVALGELVAVPKLPTGLLLDDRTLSLGAQLSGGEKIVFGAIGVPRFSLILGDSQARLVPAGASVSMTYEGKQWNAVVGQSTRDESGQTSLALTAPDGGTVCGADCGLISAGSDVGILSKVVVVPPASGPAVPVAAITTQPDGQTVVTVVDSAGVRATRPVTVQGSQDGVAVVSGLMVGEKVQVLEGRPRVPAPVSSSTPTA